MIAMGESRKPFIVGDTKNGGTPVVELQSGAEDCDRYNRLLRYVYIDGTFVNAELVAEGYARAYIFNPGERYSQILVQLEQYARLRKQGIWMELQTGG